MPSEPGQTMKPGTAFVLIMLGWAVLGASIVLTNQDSPENLDQATRIFLIWPVFLFVAPPGWALLAYVSQKLNENSSSGISIDNAALRQPTNEFNLVGNPQESPSEQFDRENQPSVQSHKITDEMSPALDDNGVQEEDIWSAESEKVVAESYGWRCQRCFQRISSEDWLFNSSNLQRLVLEHIIPVTNGGSNNLTNMRPVHAKCAQTNINLPSVARGDWNWNEEVSRPYSNQTWTRPPSKPVVKSSEPSGSRSPRGNSSSKRKPISERLGDWRRPESVLSQLARQLDRAKISDIQRKRAREFIEAHHENELLRTCQRGHAMSLENTYFSPPKEGFIQRQCRQCRRDNK
jgi:hypothetical protein